MSELPDFVVEKLKQLSKITNKPFEELERKYKEEFEEERDWLYEDEQFTSDEDRHAYFVRRFHAKVINEPRTIEIELLVYGITEKRQIRDSGRWMSRIYGIAKVDDKTTKAVIVCPDETADLIDEVRIFNKYKVRVSPTNTENLFFATSETKFRDPTPVKDPIKILKSVAKTITVAESVTNPSKTIKSGNREFVDEFDLRLLRGIIIRYNSGKRDDGTDYAVYTIGDDSVVEETTTSDGKIIPRNLTVWIPKQLMKYGTNSEVYVAGTVVISNNRPMMNAVSIYPIHAKYLE